MSKTRSNIESYLHSIGFKDFQIDEDTSTGTMTISLTKGRIKQFTDDEKCFIKYYYKPIIHRMILTRVLFDHINIWEVVL